jgi:hypothetical protein
VYCTAIIDRKRQSHTILEANGVDVNSSWRTVFKETVSRDFWPLVFFHKLSTPRPLINTLKYFRILFRIRRASRLLSVTNFDSALRNIGHFYFMFQTNSVSKNSWNFTVNGFIIINISPVAVKFEIPFWKSVWKCHCQTQVGRMKVDCTPHTIFVANLNSSKLCFVQLILHLEES